MINPTASAPQEAPPLAPSLTEKYSALRQWLGTLGSAITAYSGGVDSTLVAVLAHQALADRALAVTSGSESLKRDELDLAESLARRWGFAHRVIQTREMTLPGYRANPVNRCYFCKTTLYAELRRLADAEGFAAVLSGTNADDLGDHRPGLQAAGEHGVLSPLARFGLNKAEVRALALHLGLPNHDKPQSACLSSRCRMAWPFLRRCWAGSNGRNRCSSPWASASFACATTRPWPASRCPWKTCPGWWNSGKPSKAACAPWGTAMSPWTWGASAPAR